MPYTITVAQYDTVCCWVVCTHNDIICVNHLCPGSCNVYSIYFEHVLSPIHWQCREWCLRLSGISEFSGGEAISLRIQSSSLWSLSFLSFGIHPNKSTITDVRIHFVQCILSFPIEDTTSHIEHNTKAKKKKENKYGSLMDVPWACRHSVVVWNPYYI